MGVSYCITPATSDLQPPTTRKPSSSTVGASQRIFRISIVTDQPPGYEYGRWRVDEKQVRRGSYWVWDQVITTLGVYLHLGSVHDASITSYILTTDSTTGMDHSFLNGTSRRGACSPGEKNNLTSGSALWDGIKCPNRRDMWDGGWQWDGGQRPSEEGISLCRRTGNTYTRCIFRLGAWCFHNQLPINERRHRQHIP